MVSDIEGTAQDSFNPWIQTQTFEPSQGLVYESLLRYNLAKPGPPQPWLATSWKWSEGDRVLTLHLRHGVRWSDGKPFTSADAAYSLELLKRYPALNTNAITFKSVRASGPYTVVMTFNQPASVELYYIASQVWMVPKHIWSKAKNPTTYEDSHPVGTGPYELGSWSTQQVTFTKNKYYWQKGEPRVDNVVFKVYESAANLFLHMNQGSFDFATHYWPSLYKIYVKERPKYRHYWFRPYTTVVMFPNDQAWPFSIVDVRKAVDHVIDRKQIAWKGDQGFLPPASLTGLPLPVDQAFVPAKYRHQSTAPDLNLASRLMRQAGFSKRGGDWVSRSGRRATATLDAPTCCADTLTMAQVMANELTSFGIKTTLRGMDSTLMSNDVNTGHYSLAFSEFMGSGPSPYYLFYPVMHTAGLPPVGKTASLDQERWVNPEANSLLNQYQLATTDGARLRIDHQLEALMEKDVPVIPVVNFVGWFEYSTRNLVGWPTAKNPYALTYEPSGTEHIILGLRPRS